MIPALYDTSIKNNITIPYSLCVKMETGHSHTAQHKYIKILACKDWNVTKNLTTHGTLAWQHMYKCTI